MEGQQETRLDASTDLATFLQGALIVELFGPEALDPQREDPRLLQFVFDHQKEVRDEVLEDPELLSEVERDRAEGMLSPATLEHIEKKIHFHKWAH